MGDVDSRERRHVEYIYSGLGVLDIYSSAAEERLAVQLRWGVTVKNQE